MSFPGHADFNPACEHPLLTCEDCGGWGRYVEKPNLPDCPSCGGTGAKRDELARRCDHCGDRVYSHEVGQATAETLLCSDCLKRALQ